MIVAVLSSKFAAVLADTRSTITGPARLPLFGVALTTTDPYRVDPDGNMALEDGERIIVDGPHPVLAKVKLSEGGAEAFAFAGKRDGATLFLGLDGATSGLAADEQVAAYFAERACLDRVLEVPSGEYDGWSGLHVYWGGGRYIAAKFDASPVHLCRWYVRSRTNELRFTVIGSGALEAEQMVNSGRFAGAWQELEREGDTVEIDAVVALWVRVFAQVAGSVTDVNSRVDVWVHSCEACSFEYRGCFAVLPDSGG